MGAPYDIKIDQNITPTIAAPRKVPLSLQIPLKNKLDELVNKGILKKVTEPTDWVSSLVIVKKPNGSLRICMDPSDLNKAIQRSHYPLPTIEDIIP